MAITNAFILANDERLMNSYCTENICDIGIKCHTNKTLWVCGLR